MSFLLRVHENEASSIGFKVLKWVCAHRFYNDHTQRPLPRPCMCMSRSHTRTIHTEHLSVKGFNLGIINIG